MKPQTTEWIWLDTRETVSLAELSQACGLSSDELGELIDYGALQPSTPLQPHSVFSNEVLPHASALPSPCEFGADWVTRLRTAASLRQHYDLDLFSMGMMLGYLTRIEDLERQLASLLAQSSAAPWSRLQHGTDN
jgi:chaperone modulatory protein CbpM